MNVTNPMGDPSEIERLVAVAGSDAEVLADLDGCVARLHEVQRAKAALARLDTFSLRSALAARRKALGGESR